jgi:uncharacterized membrane protein
MINILSLHPSIFVIVGIVTSALAQILLKRGSAFELLALKWIFWLTLSILSYFIAFLTYFIALKSYDISKISPIMMVSIVSIISIYGYFTGEHFSAMKMVGIILAIMAIYLIARY